MIISKAIMTSSQLNKLFKSARNCKRLWFDNCVIVIDSDLDFKGTGEYKMESLMFPSTGSEARSNWKSNKQDLEKIIIALTKSNLVANLKEINLYNCDCDQDQDQLAQLLTDNHKGSIKLTYNQQAIDKSKISSFNE